MPLLFLLVVGLVLSMAGGVGARSGAEAAAPPCPSTVILKACAVETPSDALAPRGTVAVDAPCQGKAVHVASPNLEAPSACRLLAFEVASASWSAWWPPTPARPPRS